MMFITLNHGKIKSKHLEQGLQHILFDSNTNVKMDLLDDNTVIISGKSQNHNLKQNGRNKHVEILVMAKQALQT